jgi:hypothetical protein
MGNINPFNLDAATASEKEIARLSPHGGTAIEDFCGRSHNVGEWHERGICVLRARKGFGKSHLISIRSINHRDSKAANQTLFYPSGGYPRYLLDPLTDLEGVVPRWLEGKEAIDAWVSVWQLAITGLLVWISDVETLTLNGYAEWFGSLEELNAVHTDGDTGKPENGLVHGQLTMFMGRIINKLKDDTYSESKDKLSAGLFAANSDWAAAITKHLDAISKIRVALYLDAPDEMVSMDRVNLWRNVQQGLLMAIWKFSKTNPWSRLLNIYASVRSEAFGSEEDHPNIKMAESLVMPLQYTRQDLESILNDRIALAEPRRLVMPIDVASSPLEALCGFSQVVHHDRTNLGGSNYCESIFDAILRHTREIPRELIAMASAVYNINLERRNQDAVRVAVNATAAGNIGDSIKHSFLGWDDAKHRSLALKMDRQVMGSDEVMKLTQDFGAQGSAIVKLFIQHGLLGVSEGQPRRHKNFYFQQFAFDQVHGDEKSSTVTKDFYFVHPAFKEWIISLPEFMGRRFVRSTRGAIGNGIPYEVRPPNIRLGFELGKGVITFGPTAQHLSPSNIGANSYPLKVLFLCLLTCHEFKRKAITIAMVVSVMERIKSSKSILMSVCTVIEDTDKGLAWTRDQAKKVNRDSDVRAFQLALNPANENSSKGKKTSPPQLLFVSAKSSIGASPQISIPCLDLLELDFSDELHALVAELPKH